MLSGAQKRGIEKDVEDTTIQNEVLMLLITVFAVLHNTLLIFRMSMGKDRLDVKDRVFMAMRQQPSR